MGAELEREDFEPCDPFLEHLIGHVDILPFSRLHVNNPEIMNQFAKMTETQLVNWCLRAMCLRGISCWRQNTGGMKIPDKGKRQGYRFIKFGKKGAADITGLLKDGRRIEVECKVGSNKQSEDQVIFQRMIEINNGIYILCYSPQELITKLEEMDIK